MQCEVDETARRVTIRMDWGRIAQMDVKAMTATMREYARAKRHWRELGYTLKTGHR